MSKQYTDTIRELNDNFRTGKDSSIPGKFVFTSGLQHLITENEKFDEEVAQIVRSYNAFTEDNDPHKEHDFGAFDFCGEKIYWKIDYYDSELQHGSNDPSDPEKTYRLLTVFLANEY